jgi:hypothetical protein
MDTRADDERECAALTTAFAFYTDRRRYEELAALFVEDGIFDRPGLLAKSRSEILSAMLQRATNIATRHLCQPPMFTSHSDNTLEAVTCFTFYQAEIPAEGFPQFERPTAVAEYRDVFRRTADGWRIARREAHVAMVGRT